VTDLSLFAQLLWKVGVNCGAVPGVFVFYASQMLVRALGRVPSPYTSGEKVVRDGNVKGASIEDFFSARSGSAENHPREVDMGCTRSVA